MKRVTEMYGKDVYTEDGEYFGEVDEVVLEKNKISGWKVRATRGSLLSRSLGGAKGVLIPHQLVRSVGDILIIARSTITEEGSEPR
jgi:sporulation protein YlmC with PRC-barrel domain